MTAYYNEIEPYAAQWLRNLISGGLIPAGDVDERSIEDVKPDDLKTYTQCHFFAGIGGWALALRLAGWPDNRPVWTGSCPCQPFSTAGKGEGFSDERHLWPSWYHLIGKRKPPVIFGEQVAAAVGHGWLDLVYEDLEAKGYEVGSVVLPACSVGAPHKRDRLWFVADASEQRREREQVPKLQVRQKDTETWRAGGICSDVANAESVGRKEREQLARDCGEEDLTGARDCRRDADGARVVADTDDERPQGQWRHEQQHGEEGRQEPLGHHWVGGVLIDCPDGKARLVEPSIPLLAHGVPARVGRLRAYGNAIVPPLAAEFIKASMESFPFVR